MTGESILAVGAAVVTVVQLVKWAGIPDKYGPIAVMALSLFGVIFWGWSQGDITRATAFSYFAGWGAVSTTAAGIFGFTRASGDAVSKMTSPPLGGAGSSTTLKP